MDHSDIQDAQIDLMRDIIGRGDTFTFRAFGHSMFPMIPPGTEITVRPLRSLPPPVGTVVVAERDGTLVCHRLVKLTRTSTDEGIRWRFHLRGDNLAVEDPPFDEAMIVGEIDSLRFGKMSFSADLLPYKLTGSAWASFPRPARLGLSVLRALSLPGRRAVETIHGRLQRISGGRVEIRVVEPPSLASFQGRAVHLGLAWNRDRTARLREDLEAGRALLLEANLDDRLIGSLLAVTGEITGASWLEYLRLAYPRRGTGLDYRLVERAIRDLPALGFRTLHAQSGRPLSERRLKKLGFRRRERLGDSSWTWVRRL
jgi:hypothetical protein